MSSVSSQIKVTLPGQLYGYLKTKSDRLGLSMAGYVKNLIIDDVKSTEIPTFKLSAKNEKVALQALKDHRQNKTKEIDNISEYLNNL